MSHLNFRAKNGMYSNVDKWWENSNYFENKRNSHRSQYCKTRLFMWFSNTVLMFLFFLKCYDIYTLSWKTKTLVLVVWERHRHEGLLGKCYTTAVIHNNNPDLLFVSTLEFRQCDSMKLKVFFPATLSLEPNNFHEKTWPYIQIESINESYTLII